MSITIHTPRELIDKHTELFALALCLFFVGFLIGLQPQYGQVIIEKAKQIEMEPTATFTNFRAIFVNNGIISLAGWVGWFLTPMFGLDYFPPVIIVYSVGAAYGAVAGYFSVFQLLVTLASFGIMEAVGLIFGFVAGLLFPKYMWMKLTGKAVAFSGYAVDMLSLMFYSAVALLAGALFEAFLINPQLTIIGMVGGVVVTFFFVKFVLQKV